jgi:putative tryptophan/tyrosine transport system substrate-binding protein
MMAQGRKAWLAVLFACVACYSHAGEPLPVQVLGPDGGATENFRSALAARADLSVSFVSDPDQARLILALGEAAFSQANKTRLPVIGVHIPRQVVTAAREGGCLCTAVYREVPVADQLRVLRGVLPGARKVGVLLGPESVRLREQLEFPPLLFEIRVLKDADELAASLGELLPRVDVLLALPDATLYNPDTARLLLLASYRQTTPVIGPDEQFVRAGSLAAAHPSPEGLIEAAAMLLQYAGLPGQLPPPGYARATISVNNRVARSYGVIAPDIEAIRQGLEARE